MRTDVKRRGWTISAEGNDLADRFLESVFFTGNGRMGARVTRLPADPPAVGRRTFWLAFMTGSPTAQS